MLPSLGLLVIKAICEQNGMVCDVLIVAVTRGQEKALFSQKQMIILLW